MEAIACDNPLEAIGNQQAVIKQIAEILKFVFLFDNEKIMHPSIQNDFSYYRRVFHKMKNKRKMEQKGEGEDEDEKKKKKSKSRDPEELANRMSFFFAYPTPLMKVLIDSTTKLKTTNLDFDKLILGLSTLADTCTKSLLDLMDEDNFKDDLLGGNDHNSMLLLCAMTGSVILIDHLHPNGVFHNKSPVQIKHSVETLFTFSNDYISKPFLINSLRFTTLHLNDEETISSVKRLLTNV